ncbi:hypothetical protein [Calothrix sp. 336/3]|nr:hypothetical protein [Calothrix sp. 336/3]
MHWRAKFASWGCLVVAIALLSLGATQSRKIKPWLFGCSVGALCLGVSQRTTVKQLGEILKDTDEASRLNFKAWISQQTAPNQQLSITVPALTADWQPENLINNPIEYIQKKQKHVALVGGTGDGKSTFTQYLSSKIGGSVVVYDSDSKPDDWAWLDQLNVIGRKGDFAAINQAMGDDLKVLQELVQLRGDRGDSVLSGRERFLIAEEFPILVDECDNAATWIKRLAKRGRRYKQFICCLAQNDTAENFGLAGDKETLYSCFVLVRLGSFGVSYAKTKLKDERLSQWLKLGGKKRFMVDDMPCELDLSGWGVVSTSPQLPQVTEPTPQLLNEFEQAIIDAGDRLQGEIIKARYLQQNVRLFGNITADEIRILFQVLADKGIGETVGEGDRLGWRL